MRKIGFVGVFDKTDLILCLSKILIKSQQRVLFIDGTSVQKTKYVVPSIIPTRSYITTYQDIDVAVGFEKYEKVIQYIGVEEEASLEYDFIFVDVDDYEGFEDFDLYRFDLLYYITSFDAYSLNKGIEILRFLETPTYNSTYTYISDIDILICESILDFHKNNLIDNCYHNVIRGYCNKHTLMSRITFL